MRGHHDDVLPARRRQAGQEGFQVGRAGAVLARAARRAQHPAKQGQRVPGPAHGVAPPGCKAQGGQARGDRRPGRGVGDALQGGDRPRDRGRQVGRAAQGRQQAQLGAAPLHARQEGVQGGRALGRPPAGLTPRQQAAAQVVVDETHAPADGGGRAEWQPGRPEGRDVQLHAA